MTKENIYRHVIKEDLRHAFKGDVIFSSSRLGVMTLLFLPIIILAFHVAKQPMEWVISIGGVVLLMLPLVLFLAQLLLGIKMFRLVGRGGFSIVKDTVKGMSRGEVISRHSTADVLYFTKYGRFIPSQTTFDLSAVGDEFYLVVLGNKKKDICYAYHTKIYECDDLD